MKRLAIGGRRLLLLVLVLAFAGLAGVSALAADSQPRQGLTKEGSGYYFYQDDVRVTNTWKTVKGYTYYFGADGKAYRCTSRPGAFYDATQIIVVKTINGKKYGFDFKGRMAKGVYADRKGKLYCFNRKTGVYHAKNTKKLRALAVKGKNAAELRRLIEKLDKKKGKRRVYDGCNPPGSKDIVYTFAHVTINAYRGIRRTTDQLTAGAVSPR